MCNRVTGKLHGVSREKKMVNVPSFKKYLKKNIIVHVFFLVLIFEPGFYKYRIAVPEVNM